MLKRIKKYIKVLIGEHIDKAGNSPSHKTEVGLVEHLNTARGIIEISMVVEQRPNGLVYGVLFTKPLIPNYTQPPDTTTPKKITLLFK